MRHHERYALEAVVAKYGGEFIEGGDPPDGYVIGNKQKIAVEVTRLIQHVTDERGVVRSTFAYASPAFDLIKQLDSELRCRIPSGKYVFLIVPTPINNLRETKKRLSEEILEFVASGEAKERMDICSNSISISVYEGNRESGDKVIAALPNIHSSAHIGSNVNFILNNRICEKEKKRIVLCDVDEYWLALVNEYPIASVNSYQVSYRSLGIEHGFDRILLINDSKSVHELYKKNDNLRKWGSITDAFSCSAKRQIAFRQVARLGSTNLEEEVLRKIGRSVVNFQKLEGMLKSLSWVSNYAGTLTDIQRQHAKHADALRKKSLGMVVSDFFEKIYVDSGSAGAESQPSDHGLRFNITGGNREQLKALLETIVQERNELIHSRLLGFDAQSTASCTELNTFLDEQHERITPMLREIWFLFENMKKTRAAFMELTSADFETNDDTPG